MEIHSKSELQQIAINHSPDNGCKDYMKVYRKFTNKPYSSLTVDTTLPVINSSRFRKYLLD